MPKFFNNIPHKNPILGQGELITEDTTRSRGGSSPIPIRSFEQAQVKLIPQLEQVLENHSSISNQLKLSSRAFFSIDLDSAFLAKSYFPSSVLQKHQLRVVGTRYWSQNSRDNRIFDEAQQARRIFIKSDLSSIELFIQHIKKATLTKTEQDQLTRIDSIFFDDPTKVKIPQNFLAGAAELIFHPMSDEEWNECYLNLVNLGFIANHAPLSDLQLQFYADDIRFIPTYATKALLEKIQNLNPLRTARILSRIETPSFIAYDEQMLQRALLNSRSGSESPSFEVGVFDGGVDPAAGLGPWITTEELTTEPPSPDWLSHGTAVCSAAIFGSLSPSTSNYSPKTRVRSFRIYPEEPYNSSENFTLYQIIPKIMSAVEDPKNKHIKVFILSSGPSIPIEDDNINPLTAMIDKLCYEHDILFAIAAGNAGNHSQPYDRIQPPSDCVNGISVGSYAHDAAGTRIKASYSCNGPGRAGSHIKPDLLGFGGDQFDPFYVQTAYSYPNISIKGISGTSFAAPVIGQKSAALLHGVDNATALRPQTAKALLIHDAALNGRLQNCSSWGTCHNSPENILSCYDNEATIIFNGDLPFKKSIILPIPFPEHFSSNIKIDIEWTIVYSTPVAPNAPDEYTIYGSEVHFIPNRYNYNFCLKNPIGTCKRQKVDIRNTSIVNQLISEGWTQSKNTITKSYKKEGQLRNEGKWDTVIRGQRSCLSSGLADPYLHLHALSRGYWGHMDIDLLPKSLTYAAIITTRVRSQNINLYNQVRARWPQLIPVRIRSRINV